MFFLLFVGAFSFFVWFFFHIFVRCLWFMFDVFRVVSSGFLLIVLVVFCGCAWTHADFLSLV